MPEQMYVGVQLSEQWLAVPIAAAESLTKVFPWLAMSRSSRPAVADELAAFAEEALAWADLTLPSALEGWPDEWPSE
jgi:hypothetical protein